MTPADTPAPSPSQESSALDALLSGVDAAAGTGHVEYIDALADAAPRLAAIVRVLREALSANLDSSNVVPSKVPGWRMVSAEVLSMARTALARAEAIAKGDA